MTSDDLDFYESMPVLENFADAVRAENYRPLPDGWVVGFSDVVGSTEAVAQGRYKAVNMIGGGVIAAVANALKRRPFPFVFGGDGASFAVAAVRRACGGATRSRRWRPSRGRNFEIDSPRRDDSGRRDPGGRTGRQGRALRRFAALSPMRCFAAAASLGSRSGPSAATMRSRPHRRTPARTSPGSPADGASRRPGTASFCR